MLIGMNLSSRWESRVDVSKACGLMTDAYKHQVTWISPFYKQGQRDTRETGWLLLSCSLHAGAASGLWSASFRQLKRHQEVCRKSGMLSPPTIPGCLQVLFTCCSSLNFHNRWLERYFSITRYNLQRGKLRLWKAGLFILTQLVTDEGNVPQIAVLAITLLCLLLVLCDDSG